MTDHLERFATPPTTNNHRRVTFLVVVHRVRDTFHQLQVAEAVVPAIVVLVVNDKAIRNQLASTLPPN